MVEERCWGCTEIRNDFDSAYQTTDFFQSCYRLIGVTSRHLNLSEGGTPTIETETGPVSLAVVRATGVATRGENIAAGESPSIANSTVRPESVAVAGVLPPTESKSTKLI